MAVLDEDRFLTRREADVLIAQGAQAQSDRMAVAERERHTHDEVHDAAHEAHAEKHAAENRAVDAALVAEREQGREHNLAHAKAHDAHEEKHAASETAVRTALAAVAREREIHASAHVKEHEGHLREHALNNLAIDKAEAANDKRFTATNAFRETFETRVQAGATKESVDALRKELDRRFEDIRKEREAALDGLRHQVATLEKTDVKAEGRGLGQGALVAYIVTAISILGSLIVIVNLLTAA